MTASSSDINFVHFAPADDEQDSVSGDERGGADEEEGGAAGGAQQVAEEDLGAGTEGEGPQALVQ